MVPTRLAYQACLHSKLATATDAEIKEPDPFTDIDEDENELEENEVVLEDC